MACDQSALGLLRGLSQRRNLLHQTFPLPICLCPHPFISASASSSLLASESPFCSIRFTSPFYSGVFSIGEPPQHRCFSSAPFFQQLEAESTIINHVNFFPNVCLTPEFVIHGLISSVPSEGSMTPGAIYLEFGSTSAACSEHFDFFPHAFSLIPFAFRHFYL